MGMESETRTSIPPSLCRHAPCSPHKVDARRNTRATRAQSCQCFLGPSTDADRYPSSVACRWLLVAGCPGCRFRQMQCKCASKKEDEPRSRRNTAEPPDPVASCAFQSDPNPLNRPSVPLCRPSPSLSSRSLFLDSFLASAQMPRPRDDRVLESFARPADQRRTTGQGGKHWMT